MKTKFKIICTLTLVISGGSVHALGLANGEGGKESSGIPNPAAVYCKEKGGTSVMLQSNQGELGFCEFDRGLIGQWTLLHNRQEQTEAARLFLQHPEIEVSVNGNPASIYCEKLNGKVEILKDQDGNEWGVCRFSDRSVIEEWTLFRGPAEHARLAKILRNK